jgi:hypothetical protein
MSDTTPSAKPAPVIEPRAAYSVEQARLLLDLPPSTLDREIRLGRLRCSMRAGRRWILGTWLLRWLADGAKARLKRSRVHTNGTATTN